MSAICKYASAADELDDNELEQLGAMSGTAAARYLNVGATVAKEHKRRDCVCYRAPLESPAKTDIAGESENHDPKTGSSYVRFSETAWGHDDYVEFIRSKGQDPDKVTFTWGWTSNATGSGFWNKLNNVRPITDSAEGGPAWPVIQQAEPATFHLADRRPKPTRGDKKLALKGADTQIGYRQLPDGTLDPFHDEAAMECFVQAAMQLQPDKIQFLGDFLDLASQGRFAQEAAFANTTQAALNTGHAFLAKLRAICPEAEIVVIEGNHDKRMQNFIEANAVAAFGLKRAGMPDSWPVMSLPYLLRLDELGVKYVDAYPAATDWDNDTTRNIHGTKANSKGSTTAQYVHEIPHLNTWAGHTHRAEITYHSVIGPRGEPIESYSANPGCLCRVDGAVPSVKGAIGADGSPARIVENWQQGFGLAYYNDAESWPFVYRIRDGVALMGGMELRAA